MKKEALEYVEKLLATPKKIVIIPHRNPDGDAMGSTLALCHFLLKLGHDAVVISPNDYPQFLAWMPGAENIVIYESDKERSTQMLNSAEIVFTLDFNALHRTGEMEKELEKLSAPFIMIDHHQNPDDYAAVMYSDPEYGSTCEMVYNFIGFLGKQNLIDISTATCIYTGIVTDSGSFKYRSVTSETHRIAAVLIEIGVDNNYVHNMLFDNNSMQRLRILGIAIDSLKVFYENRTAYMHLSQADLDRFQHQKGDTEGIVNYALSIKGIDFAALFTENAEDKMIRISFRSQNGFDVNKFAREHFQGGGHLNAAGGKSYESLEATTKKFEEIISNEKVLQQ